jgi:hypothetical protein
MKNKLAFALWLLWFLVLILFLVSLFYEPDETADASKQIADALAKREHKLVLLEFGANWCGDAMYYIIYLKRTGWCIKSFSLTISWCGLM